MFFGMLAALVAVAHAEPPAPAVVILPPETLYVSGLDPSLAQAAAYSAAYREQWAQRNGGALPALGTGMAYVSPGTVATPSGNVACPDTLAEIDTLEERVACLEKDVDYVISVLEVR